MKLLFNLEYQTTFGEELVLNILKGNGKVEQHKMGTLNGLNWTCTINHGKALSNDKKVMYVDYYY